MRKKNSLLLTIIVDNGSHEFVFLQHREELQCFALAQDVAALQTLGSGNQVVHFNAGPVIRQLPPPVWNINSHYQYQKSSDAKTIGKFF